MRLALSVVAMSIADEIDFAESDALYTIGQGRRVAGQLVEHDRTQEDAARVLGLSQAAVNRRLKGHVPFTTPELARIALWLGVPFSDLLPPRTAIRAAALAAAESWPDAG